MPRVYRFYECKGSGDLAKCPACRISMKQIPGTGRSGLVRIRTKVLFVPGASRRRRKKLVADQVQEPTRFGDWEKNGRCIDF